MRGHVVLGAAPSGSSIPADSGRVAVTADAGDKVQTDVRAAVVVGAADGTECGPSSFVLGLRTRWLDRLLAWGSCRWYDDSIHCCESGSVIGGKGGGGVSSWG